MFIVTTPIQRVSSVGAACFNARINPASVTFRSYGASEIPVNVQVYKHFVPNGTLRVADLPTYQFSAAASASSSSSLRRQ